MKKLMNTKNLIFIVALVVFLGLIIIPALAWQNPSQGPTGCSVNDLGCYPPINVSNSSQQKTGHLAIGNVLNLTLPYQLEVSGTSLFTGQTQFVGQTQIESIDQYYPTIFKGNTDFFNNIVSFTSGKVTFTGETNIVPIAVANKIRIYPFGSESVRNKVLTAADDFGQVEWRAAEVGITATGEDGQILKNTNDVAWKASNIIYVDSNGNGTGRIGIGPEGADSPPNEGQGFGYAPPIGLGSPDPAARLDVAGKIRIRGTPPTDAPAMGKILTSMNADGLAEWKFIDTDSTNLSVNPASGRLDFADCNPPTAGQIWLWSGVAGGWVCGNYNPFTISGTPASGHTLRYDGTNWVTNRIIYNDGTDVVISSYATSPTTDTKLTVLGKSGIKVTGGGSTPSINEVYGLYSEVPGSTGLVYTAAIRAQANTANLSNPVYGIYQTGTAKNYFQGPVVLYNNTAGAVKPSCVASYRGMLWYNQGAGGTDTIEVCAPISGAYSWRALF